MAHHLTIQHLAVSGDGFSPDAGEAYLDLIVGTNRHGEHEVLSATDLDSGAAYDCDGLEQRVDALGRQQIDDAIAEAVEYAERTGSLIVRCTCELHAVRMAA